MKKPLRQIVKEKKPRERLPILDEVFVTEDGVEFEKYLTETRKWVSGRFERNLGIDQPTYGAGKTHAHVLGRDRQEIVIVNVDGTGSHGTKGRLHPDDADALRQRGFNIPDDNIIEWTSVGTIALLLR